jgi:hypothetical protein
MGGLGNWLFQVAATMKFSQDAGLAMKLSMDHCDRSPHSDTMYISNILSKFDIVSTKGKRTFVLNEPGKLSNINNTQDMIRYYSDKVDFIIFHGYFQRFENIPRIFPNMLTLPEVDGSHVSDTCFIHIRGGDYINHWLHDVKLGEKYYDNAIEFMKGVGITKFSVFTNDKKHAMTHEFLKNIDYEFIDSNELETLALFKHCKAGITANSTFSWWGAFLNTKRPLCIPSKWFNDPEYDISGYFFNGVTVHTV